ncbi:MAG: SIR2 family protein [Chloroflexi bacterium]|nr:SIR2 family protein [Chloroflexota bacterium]
MVDLRQILSQGRKRLGLLLGAGAPMSLLVDERNNIDSEGSPLIPDVARLTDIAIETLCGDDRAVIEALFPDRDGDVNIETILTRIRRLSEAIENERIYGLNGSEYTGLAERICTTIGGIVSPVLPDSPNPYTELTTWIGGTYRDHPVEIFTPNYDLLLEESFERNRLPYFDGFSGSHRPFFDPASISSDSLPARWSRLWKIHGSLGWEIQDGNIIRTGSRNATSLIYPDHLKYDRIEKQPYTAMFERLKSFLNTPDSLLLCTGFSFFDAHITAILDEALAANTHTAVIAFQFRTLQQEEAAKELAIKRRNLSVYARDGGVIFGIEGKWRLGESPTEEWLSIRNTFWDAGSAHGGSFLLGDFAKLARFVALTRAESLVPAARDDEDEALRAGAPGADEGDVRPLMASEAADAES